MQNLLIFICRQIQSISVNIAAGTKINLNSGIIDFL